jgi:hypothetical protein
LTRRQKITLAAAAATIVVAVAAAWALELANADAPGYRIAVVREGAVVTTFDLGELRSMPSRHVVMQGSRRKAASCLTPKAGVTAFRQGPGSSAWACAMTA